MASKPPCLPSTNIGTGTYLSTISRNPWDLSFHLRPTRVTSDEGQPFRGAFYVSLSPKLTLLLGEKVGLQPPCLVSTNIGTEHIWAPLWNLWDLSFHLRPTRVTSDEGQPFRGAFNVSLSPKLTLLLGEKVGLQPPCLPSTNIGTEHIWAPFWNPWELSFRSRPTRVTSDEGQPISWGL